MININNSVLKLQKYIKNENYAGHDPFDALTSLIFRLPFFNSNKIIRLGAQQVLKRLPINIRPLIGIKKGLNPVTLGLCIQAYSYLLKVFPENKSAYYKEIDFLLIELEKVSSKGYSGICWGYDFDWEARYAKIPAYTPTIVATGIITNSLFENYKVTGKQSSFNICKNSVEFVLDDLNRTIENNSFCFSYSPIDKQIVYNATMKGARLLAQVYSITKNELYSNEAKRTVKYVCDNQKKDGSWSYSKGDTRTWVDNFHTGYILDCLGDYQKYTGDEASDRNFKKGIEYYKNIFFVDNQIPKYYNNSLYPIDSTAVAQSILTMSRFGFIDIAINIANWTIDNMQDKAGYFYYRKHKLYTNKISYMRWNNAWMLLAFSYLLYKIKGKV